MEKNFTEHRKKDDTSEKEMTRMIQHISVTQRHNAVNCKKW